MKLKYALSLIAIVAISKTTFAQYSQDAIRFSTTQNGSTARIKALGNASISLGGDLSNISGNPAGLGFFTRSEISLTPSLEMNKSNAGYLGSSVSNKKTTGNLDNASVVFYSRLRTPQGTDKTKGWLSANFGLSYSRTQNFNQTVGFGGMNNTSSINDYFASVNDANYQDPLAAWAYDQYLIYDSDDNHQNSRSASLPGVAQNGLITRTGGQTEFNIAFGANYSNNFYIGAGVGIANVRFDYTNIYTESGTLSLNEDNTSPVVQEDFTSSYVRNQSTRGTGVNVKLGMIFKPTEALRVGLNFTSPTWYDMEDNFSEQLQSYVGSDLIKGGPDMYPYKYVLRTPLKIAGGLSYFFGNAGFITGDVEYVDYSSANLSANADYTDYNNTSDNADIRTYYKGAVNTRVGAEAKLGRFAYLRGGYNIFGNPAKENGSTIKTASGGVGFRSGHYSVDATYAHKTGKQTYYPYEIGSASPAATISNTADNVYLTLSYRF